jgi:hypothetical protein
MLGGTEYLSSSARILRDESPSSTLPRGEPHNVLTALPSLPADLEYRFLGHHLILVDTRANMILDRIPGAIECSRQ